MMLLKIETFVLISWFIAFLSARLTVYFMFKSLDDLAVNDIDNLRKHDFWGRFFSRILMICSFGLFVYPFPEFFSENDTTHKEDFETEIDEIAISILSDLSDKQIEDIVNMAKIRREWKQIGDDNNE